MNAAVDGSIAGGDSEVIVWDGNDGSQTLFHADDSFEGQARYGSLGRFDDDGPPFLRGHLHRAQQGKCARRYHGAQLSSLGIQNISLNGTPAERRLLYSVQF